MKSKTIITGDREIYEKFNMLNFSNEIVFGKSKDFNLRKILSSINKQEPVLLVEKTNNFIKLKKINPYRFNAYFYKK